MNTVLALLAATPAAVPSMPDADVGGGLLRVVFSLAGIIVVVFGASWLTRRMQGRRFVDGRRVKCLETMPIGARERVLLIEADGKRLLIGVAAGSVCTLHVFDGTEPSPTVAPPASPSFGDVLSRWRRR